MHSPQVSAYNEYPDKITGVTQEFCSLGTDQMCTFDPYGTSNVVQTKRAIARRVGSTYAYDFLGLLEVGLVDQWDTHLKQLAANDITRATEAMPTGLFSSDELVLDDNGEVRMGSDKALRFNTVLTSLSLSRRSSSAALAPSAPTRLGWSPGTPS